MLVDNISLVLRSTSGQGPAHSFPFDYASSLFIVTEVVIVNHVFNQLGLLLFSGRKHLVVLILKRTESSLISLDWGGRSRLVDYLIVPVKRILVRIVIRRDELL